MSRAVVEPILGVTVGSYGQTIVFTVVNEKGVAQDVSGYNTITIVAIPPDRHKIVTAAATYVVAGADGKVQGSFIAGDIDVPGLWEVQIEFLVTPAAELFKTYPGIMDVGEGLRAS
jgi:hypothetical protein